MTAGSISVEDRVYYTHRGKGGKSGKRELPFRPTRRSPAGSPPPDLETMEPVHSLRPDTRTGRVTTSGTFYTNLRRYLKLAGLPLGGVHIFRHSAAKLRRDAGMSIEEVSQFLDHSSLAVTIDYLRRLGGQEDRNWERVADGISLG